jgi:hypothetical protein
MSRELNDLGDIIVNEKLTIKELYEFAKENGFEESTLYLIGEEKNSNFSDTYSEKITTFGKGWGKGTAILKFEYEKEEQMDSCPG